MAKSKRVKLPEHPSRRYLTNIEDRLKQQREYLKPYVTQIVGLAKILHPHLGRLAIGIAWPAPPFLCLVSNLLDNVLYMTQDDLRSQGVTSELPIMKMMEQYEPDYQAIVVFIDRFGLADIHPLSESPSPDVRFGPFDKVVEEGADGYWTLLSRTRE